MLKIIEVIEDANSKNCSLPALALALTLPDICSQIEYPNETNVGYRYREWYNHHVPFIVMKSFTFYKTHIMPNNTMRKMPYQNLVAMLVIN